MDNLILVINAGSSSIKFSVFVAATESLKRVYKGQIDGIGTQPRFKVKDSGGQLLIKEHWEPLSNGQGHTKAFSKLSHWLQQYIGDSHLIAVGHRVVHGGPNLSSPVTITDSVLSTLESLIPLMPLHLPHNLSAIRALRELRPDVRQVACFDTAFHQPQQKPAAMYGLPRYLYDEGVRRYGFHGLSYEYIQNRVTEIEPELACGRLIVAHLGSGASMCAMRGGQSTDTSMGFSALDGLPMGTRCGSIDPGVLLYLLGEKGFSREQLETLLYTQSGLRGISGISNDLRQLLDNPNPTAGEAIDYFVFRINRELGALTAVLGGLDGFVFTAGIGEKSPEIRRRVCDKAAWLGIELDHAANLSGQLCISGSESLTKVLVIPTDEELMIAVHTVRLIHPGSRYAAEPELHE